MVYDAVSRNCCWVFSWSLVEVTAPSSRTFPKAAAALQVQIPAHSLLIPLPQAPGRGKPLQSSLRPFQSRKGTIPKIWAKSHKLEPHWCQWAQAQLQTHPSSWGREKSLKICKNWWQNHPCLRWEQIPFCSSALQPSRELPRQNSCSHWDYLPLVVFFL